MTGIILEKDASPRLNQLAREQMKHKLLTDIMVDMTICELEGWDKTEYLKDLINLLNSLMENK